MSEGLKINGTGSVQAALARDAEEHTVIETVAPQTEVQSAPIETSPQVEVNGNGQLQETTTTISTAPLPVEQEQVFDFITPSNGQSTEQSQEITQPSNLTWQDAIKAVDRKELLKHLGIDDFAIEMNEYVSKGGKYEDYVNAKAVDWNTIPDTDLLIGELKREFPEASAMQLQRMLNKKYSQTETAEEEDKEDGLLLMKADARRKRAEKITEQSRFKMPEPKAVDTTPQPKQYTPQELEQQARLNTYFNEHESTKNLLNNKRVTVQLGEGVKPFSYNVDPKEVLGVMFDHAQNAKYGLTKTGEPDIQQTLEAILFRMNPMKFKQDLINYGKGLGEKKFVEEGQNIQKPGQQTRPAETTTDLKTLFQKPKTGTLVGKLGM